MPHTTRCRTGSSTREDDLVDAALSIAVTLVLAAFDLVSADGAMTLFASLGIEPGVSIPRGKILEDIYGIPSSAPEDLRARRERTQHQRKVVNSGPSGGDEASRVIFHAPSAAVNVTAATGSKSRTPPAPGARRDSAHESPRPHRPTWTS